MKTTKLQYAGATLEMPDWLAEWWPHDLPIDSWPTFCGSGTGLGDYIVPDSIDHIVVSPTCFIHDIDWALGDFLGGNRRLLKNLVSLVSARLEGAEYAHAMARCMLYWATVSTVGYFFYEPMGADWLSNPVVRQRLLRLQEAEAIAVGVAH